MKQRVKSYGFWVSLASAVLLFINTLGKKFNFSIDEAMYNDLLSSFCAILMILGVIVPPAKVTKKEEITIIESETEIASKLQAGELQIEEISEIRSEKCDEAECKEIVEVKSDEIVKNRSEEIVEVKSKEKVEVLSDEISEVQNDEIIETQNKEVVECNK